VVLFLAAPHTHIARVCCSLATTASHDLHATAHTHATATATTLPRRRVSAIKSAGGLRLSLFTLGVADCAVNRQDGAGGLGGSSNHVDTHDFWLPDKGLIEVSHLAVQNVDTLPEALITLLVVGLSQFIKNIGRVHTRVVGQLLGDDLEGLGIAMDDQLRLALDRSCVLTQVS